MAAALSQTGMSWEIIVTDDKSRDDSVETIRRFLAANPELPIRFNIHEVNKGFVPSIFEAVRLARGQYFWQVAGDNNVDTDTAARLLSHA
ncbi:MAG TPA: glycosyltransferase, partial [Xanthobacteraceae bacterium]|nr:glycosyltransferase [Xanthobacteraceae bacterium]